MANDTFATATALSGDAGTVAYDDSNASGMAWFLPPTTPGRFYTFTCDEPNYVMELYTGDGPMWSGLDYIINSNGGDGTNIQFTAKAGIDYSVVVYPNPGANNNLSWTSVSHAVTGWSEWVTPETSQFLVRLAQTAKYDSSWDPAGNSSSTAGYYTAYDQLGRAECSWQKDQWDHETPRGEIATDFGTLRGVIASPIPGWETYQNYSPWFGIGRLVEGVDYFPRPDRAPTDVDAYIEIESGANTIAGWQIPNIGIYWQPIYGYYNASDFPDWYDDQGFPNGSHLQVELVADLTDAPGGTPAMPSLGSGTVIANSLDAVWGTWGTTMKTLSNVTDPGPASSIALYCFDPNYVTRPMPPPTGSAVDSPYEVQGKAQFLSRPRVNIATPRYRYWIVGVDPVTPIPLRQVQRDDGLGRSVMRARGTHSVQKSIRQRGYR